MVVIAALKVARDSLKRRLRKFHLPLTQPPLLAHMAGSFSCPVLMGGAYVMH
jgi:hypothetical protein